MTSKNQIFPYRNFRSEVIFPITLRAIISPGIVLSDTHARKFTCLCCLLFISLYLISSSSTSFKLRLELNKIDFVLSSGKCIISLLAKNHSQILLQSLAVFLVTFLCWKIKQESSAYCIQDGFYYLAHIIDINQKQ